MYNEPRTVSSHIRFFTAIAVLSASTVFFAGMAGAQTRPAPAAAPVPIAAPMAPAPTEKDLARVQEELIKLLKLSPTLTTVVEHDPTLLANQEYVNRNNPQLGQFLLAHPEIARNPEFYLFTHINREGGGPDEALERAVWPDLIQPQYHQPVAEAIMGDVVPFLVFLGVLGALIWLTRMFMENRRWGRIFKLQTEVHGKLIDKFSTNQDLLIYMDTEAGKRFLEAAPIPVSFEAEQRMPNAVARVLTPLQIGIVLSLLGLGCLLLRHADFELRVPMLVLGTIILMPGIGFIISAGVTWVLAGKLGLMPDGAAAAKHSEMDLRERP
jgi:hypothetical protein